MTETGAKATAGDAATSPPRFVAFIALGANLGDVAAALNAAIAALNALPFTSVLACSSAYETRPVDSAGPDYLNAVVALGSALAPGELMHALLAIEAAHERERPYRNAPRTLDLDLLWFGDARRDGAHLTLPHPRMTQRAFVLEPLCEVCEALAKVPAAVQHAATDADANRMAAVRSITSLIPHGDARQQLAAAQGITRTNKCIGPR